MLTRLAGQACPPTFYPSITDRLVVLQSVRWKQNCRLRKFLGQACGVHKYCCKVRYLVGAFATNAIHKWCIPRSAKGLTHLLSWMGTMQWRSARDCTMTSSRRPMAFGSISTSSGRCTPRRLIDKLGYEWRPRLRGVSESASPPVRCAHLNFKDVDMML